MTMKKKISQFAIAGMLMLFSFTAFSQHKNDGVPAWVSDKGYWVVEGNVHRPLQHTVRFYNNQHIMVGSQEIAKRLNVKRKKVKMQLKSMLESTLQQWAARQAGTSHSDIAGKP